MSHMNKNFRGSQQGPNWDNKFSRNQNFPDNQNQSSNPNENENFPSSRRHNQHDFQGQNYQNDNNFEPYDNYWSPPNYCEICGRQGHSTGFCESKN